ncbi:MAG: TIGR00725 family protein [Deltaproteobacteria bacterium]|jgi:hypothetical protein|nr:TIGR00725 family protein [Deltaproteobacteria bacterium]
MRTDRKKVVIGVMGGGTIAEKDRDAAYRLGSLVARQGWILLNGGRPSGIMEASAKGARDCGGTTVGILPGTDPASASEYVDIRICTGMGDARNVINVLSSDIVIACPGSAGTISELAIALKSRKKVILLNFDVGALFDQYAREGLLTRAETPEEAIESVKDFLTKTGR